MFTTERLRLRAYQSSDKADLLAIFNNASTVGFASDDYIVPRDEKFFDKILEVINTSIMGCIIETLEESKFIGFTTLRSFGTSIKNRNGTFGISLVPEFCNQGYGTEVTRFMVDYAFRCLAMHRVSLVVYEGNDRAIAVYRKIGFVEEGTQRKANWIDGAWRDMYYMGILEDEWTALKSREE